MLDTGAVFLCICMGALKYTVRDQARYKCSDDGTGEIAQIFSHSWSLREFVLPCAAYIRNVCPVYIPSFLIARLHYH